MTVWARRAIATAPASPLLLANLARPISNAVLTFTNAQTGTVQIVGARRPRRVAQFAENAGVSARNLNQALTDIIAQNRETWDKTNDVTGRAILAPPGERLNVLPPAATRAGLGACYDTFGNPAVCANPPSGSITFPTIADGHVYANATGVPAFPGDTVPSTWFDHAYCNTVGFLLVRFTGAWTCSKALAANPVWFGADPTGASDSTSALNSALAASSQVEFPTGKFKFLSAITYNIPAGINSVTLKGAGQDNTILFWPSATGGITLNYAGTGSSAHIRDVSTGTTNGGNALTLNLSTPIASPAYTANSDVYNVTIRGDDGYSQTDFWSTGLSIQNVSNVSAENLNFEGAAGGHGNGIIITGLPGSSTYAVALNVAKSAFNNLSAGLIYGSFVQGVTVDQSNFTGVVFGITSSASETGLLVQLSVTNSQFNAATAGIVAGTVIGSAQINNNMFLVGAFTTNAVGIQMSSGNSLISSNQFLCGPNTGTTALAYTGTSSGGVVSGNLFYSCAAGISISAGTSSVMVASNQFINNTTSIINAGSNIYIAGNPGYNPVGVSSPAAPASGAAYTNVPSPATCYIHASSGISQVTLGGLGTLTVAIAANATYVVDLGPNEAFVPTYTGTLGMLCSVH